MIPSDHFVRFYNEVFKYLESLGPKHLPQYYQVVAKNQEYHCLELFRREGLKGMFDYWEHIRIEENCNMTNYLEPGCYRFSMHICPSLSKILDNDASPCLQYCNHCPGWILPIIEQSGFFAVYNLINRQKAQCEMFVYAERSRADDKYAELIKCYDKDVILTSFSLGREA